MLCNALALRGHPVLGNMFVLHGGTALNLFHDDAPRLSVDIDLMFVGAIDVDAMRQKRPEVDQRFRVAAAALGYDVQGTSVEHSGQTYRVNPTVCSEATSTSRRGAAAFAQRDPAPRPSSARARATVTGQTSGFRRCA